MGVGKSNIRKREQQKNRAYNASRDNNYSTKPSKNREQSALRKSGVDDLQKLSKETRGRKRKRK